MKLFGHQYSCASGSTKTAMSMAVAALLLLHLFRNVAMVSSAHSSTYAKKSRSSSGTQMERQRNKELWQDTTELLELILGHSKPDLATEAPSTHPLFGCRLPDMFCEKDKQPNLLIPCEETDYMNECLEMCRGSFKSCVTTWAAVSSFKPHATAHNFMRMFLMPKNITAGPDVASPPPPPAPKPLPQELHKEPPHLEEQKPVTENKEGLPMDRDLDLSAAGNEKKVPYLDIPSQRVTSAQNQYTRMSPKDILLGARQLDKKRENLARLGIVEAERGQNNP